RLARAEGFEHIRYEVRDVTTVELPPDHYDAVWFESSLHHIEPLERVCEQMARGLKPDGFLFLNEYVGPSAFAFPPRQRELIRAAFALIPSRFRRSFAPDGPEQLSTAPIPTPAEVKAEDPTESVRSADILSVVPDYFDVVSLRETGGTLLQFLLHGIAGNFQAGDPESLRVLRMLFEIEDALLEVGEMRSDFVVLAARPRKPVVPRPRRLPSPPPQEEEAAPPSLEDELAEKRTYLAQAEQYARTLEAEAAGKQAQLQELESYARKLEGELARKQARDGEIDTYARSLEEDLDSARALTQSMEMDLAAAQAYARSMETDLDSAQAYIRSREAELAAAQVYARSLEAELAKAQVHARSVEAELAKAQVHARSVEAELATAQVHARSVEAELAKAQVHARSVEAELAKAQVHARSVEAELAKAQVHARSVE